MIKKILLILVLILAFILRFYQLGINPPSLDWDEASLGYNAYSILKTARDEYGSFLPLAIRSFGDFKPPLYTYLTVIPVALLGLNELSVRLVSAIFGILTVWVTFHLARELFAYKDKKIPYLSMLMLAISPWHLQFSRVAFEANLSLFFIISGLTLFLKGIKTGRFLWGSFLAFSFSLYAYHSPRLIVPLLLIFLSIIYRREIKVNLKPFLTGIFVLAVFLLPLAVQLGQVTSARFSAVSVVNPDEKLGESIADIEFDQSRGLPFSRLFHNRRIVYAREILAGYLDHFNFDFLFLTGDPPERHHAQNMGMLYFTDLPLLILGFAFLFKNLKSPGVKTVLGWFILSPLASSLTSGTPHAVRAIFYLPSYQIIAALGLIQLGRNWLKYLIAFLLMINFFYYLHMYYVHTPIESAGEWQYGYKEAVLEAKKYENQVSSIITTYAYDQPYIYFLFYNKIDPSWYQSLWQDRQIEIKRAQRSFGKYEFRNIDFERDSRKTGTLLIGTPGEIPDGAGGLIKDIKFPNGQVAFRIIKI